MIQPDRTISISFKLFLAFLATVFAVVAVVLINSLTTAATPTGSVPASAVSLINGANTGILGPGSQRWFRLTPAKERQAGQIEQSLTLFFTPQHDQQTRQVTLQLFKADQLPFFDLDSTSHMANLGAGQIVSRDQNPETGELFWTGWLSGQESYYIQLVNGSDAMIDYWLFDEDIYQLDLVQARPSPAPGFAPGAAPQTALSLEFGQMKGKLAPGQEIWYSFTVNDLDGENFVAMALTMFTTPAEGQRLQRMNFDMFTASEIRFWSPEAGSRLHNFGAGSIVQRDNNPLTGERFWSGWLVKQDLYYLRIRNSNDIPMDYWLFTADVYQPNLEP